MSSEPLAILMASGPMSVDEVVRIGREVAAALKDAHGELTPSAIWVGDDGVGVAPSEPGNHGRHGQYAAPERILGKPPSPVGDVFSIGAILFHALAGHPPFRGDNPSAMMLAICSEPPLELPPQIPRQLETIIHRCLQKNPAERYASPAALREVLNAYARQGTWSGRRMLAADDEGSVRDLYSVVASRIGVEADVVSSGRDAIEALKTRRYDVALLDLNMPRLSGWEVLDYLRLRSEQKPKHIFIVTGFSDQLISEADRELVSAVLYKPVEPGELRSLIVECLRGATPNLAAILRTTNHRRVSAA